MDLALPLSTIITNVATWFHASADVIERTRNWQDALAENGHLLGLMDGVRASLGEDTARFIEDSRPVTEASQRFSLIFNAIKAAR